MKSVCIICGNERNGLEVREDSVLGALRWVKRNITKNPKNFHLVVCKDDFIKYRKKRESFERKQVLYISIGVLFMIVLVAFASGRYLGAITYGLLVIIFMYLLSLLSYMPAVNMPAIKEKRGK